MATYPILFADIQLSETLIRRTVYNQKFDIDYDGNTYLSDSLIGTLSPTTVTLERGDNAQTITLIGDTDVITAFRDETFRNREITIYRGIWTEEADTKLTDVYILYQGVIEIISTLQNNLFQISAINIFNRYSTVSTDISLRNLHNYYLQDEQAYSDIVGDIDDDFEDTIFRNIGSSFYNFIIGNRPGFFREVTTDKLGKLGTAFGPIFQATKTITYPALEGDTLVDTPLSWRPAKVYGRSLVQSAILFAWNTRESGLLGFRLGDWYGSRNPDSVVGLSSSRFGTVVYCVHEGPCDRLDIYLEGIGDEIVHRSYIPQSGDRKYYTTILTHGNNNDRIGIITVKFADDRTMLPDVDLRRLAGFEDDIYGPTDLGVGYLIVSITQEVTTEGPVTGLIEPNFYVTNVSSDTLSPPVLPDAPEDQVSFTWEARRLIYEDEDINNSNYSIRSFNASNKAVSQSEVGHNVDEWSDFVTIHSNRLRYLVIARDQSVITFGDLSGVGQYVRITMVGYNASTGYSVRRFGAQVEGPNFRNEPTAQYYLITKDYTLADDFPDTEYDATIEYNIIITSISNANFTLSPPEENFIPSVSFQEAIIDFLRDPISGLGLDESELDLEGFALSEFSPFVPPVCNANLQNEDSIRDYLDLFEDSSGLVLFSEGGLIKCYFGRYRYDDEVIYRFSDVPSNRNTHSITLQAQRMENKYNSYTLEYHQTIFREDGLPQIIAADNTTIDEVFIDEDGGLRNNRVLRTPYIQVFFVEQENGTIELDDTYDQEGYLDAISRYSFLLGGKSRFGDVVVIVVNESSITTLQIGDVFTVEKTSFGWTGDNIRTFTVTQYTFSHQGRVTIVGVGHSNSNYGLVDDDGIETIATPDPVIVPYDGSIPINLTAPINFTASISNEGEVLQVVSMSWGVGSDLTGEITSTEIQIRVSGSEDYMTIGSVGYPITSYLFNTVLYGQVFFRVRFIGPSAEGEFTDDFPLLIPSEINMPVLMPDDSFRVMSKDVDFDLEDLSVSNGAYDTDGIKPGDDISVMAIFLRPEVTQECIDIPVHYRVNITHENEGYERGVNYFVTREDPPPGTGIDMYLKDESESDQGYFYGDASDADSTNSRSYNLRPTKPGTTAKYMFSSRSQIHQNVADSFTFNFTTGNLITILYHIDSNIDLNVTDISLEAYVASKTNMVSLDNVDSSGVLWTFADPFNSANISIQLTPASNVGVYYDTLTATSVMVYADTDTGVTVSGTATGY